MRQQQQNPNDPNTWRDTSTGKPVAAEDLPPAVRAFAQRVSAVYDDPDGVPDLTPQQRDQMIAENVASIEAVPAQVWDALPEGQHNRNFALMWASQGRDVYAYKGFGEHGIYNLWLAGQRIELGRAE